MINAMFLRYLVQFVPEFILQLRTHRRRTHEDFSYFGQSMEDLWVIQVIQEMNNWRQCHYPS